MGLEPITSVLETEVLPLNYSLLLRWARETGIEPMTSVLKTEVLPLNYSPFF